MQPCCFSKFSIILHNARIYHTALIKLAGVMQSGCLEILTVKQYILMFVESRQATLFKGKVCLPSACVLGTRWLC